MTVARPLVGRDEERTTLLDARSRALAGAGAAVMVRGEAGIGKSRLVDELETDGMPMLVARAHELDRHRPFGVLVDALDHPRRSAATSRAQLSEAIAAAVPLEQGAGLAGPSVPLAVIDAVLHLVEELAQDGPFSLVMEDLHWADTASLVALGSVARRVFDLPVLLVCTVRTPAARGEVESFAEAMLRLGAEPLDLPPLAPEAVTEIARRRLGAEPGEMLAQQLARVGGNPLYLGAYLDALVDACDLATTDGKVEVRSPSLPPSLRLLVLNRLRLLDPETIEVLRVASVLGGSFDIDVIAGVTTRPAAQVVQAAERARAHGLLVTEGAEFGFRHQLLRDAIYDDLPEAARRALHQVTLEVLVRSGAPASRVVPHALAVADRESALLLLQASKEVGATSPSQAALLAKAAIGILGEDATAHHKVQLAEVLIAAGRAREAMAVATGLVQDRDPAVRASASVVHVQTLVAAGAFSELWRQLAEWAPTPGRPSVEDAEQLVLLAGVANMTGQTEAALEHATTALGMASELGLDHVAWKALAYKGWATHLTDGPLAAVPLLEEAAGQAREHDGLPHAYLGMTLLDLDRFDEAHQRLARARKIHERDGQLFLVGVARSADVACHFFQGQWDDAVAEGEALIALSDEFGLRIGVVVAHALIATVEIARGNLEVARRHIDVATEKAQAGAQGGDDALAYARAVLLEAEGDLMGALEAVEVAWTLANAIPSLASSPHRLYLADFMRLAVALERPAIGDRLIADLERLRDRQLVGWDPVHAQLRGLLRDDAEQIVDSLAFHREAGRPWPFARAALDAALSLARAGAVAEARPLASEAMSTLDSLGADGFASRAAAELRAAGVRLGARQSRRRPVTGWDSLTPAEMRVVDLIVQGLTNADAARKLYISHHTVETHLRHVYQKLGVATRTQLAAVVADRARS